MPPGYAAAEARGATTVTQRIAAMLHAHVSAQNLGVVTAAETGFLLARGRDTVRSADVALVAESRLPRGRTVGFFEGAPDLAVEVPSPSDVLDEAARARASAKIDEWLAAGCLEVWSVDPGSRTVRVHTARGGTRIVGESDTLESTAAPGLSVALADVFSPPAGSAGG